jgi:hypothetical protein
MRTLALLSGGLLLVGCVTEPQPVTITFCPQQVVGGRIAVRNDGSHSGFSDAWTYVDAADGRTFSFTTQPRLTIAFTETDSPLRSDLRVFQLTADELPKLDCLPSTTGDTRTYTGTITGLTTGRAAQVGLGTAAATRGNGSFTLQNSALGASDLIALMRTGPTVEKFIVRRRLDLQSGAVLDPIDFTSAEAGAPRFSSAAIGGAGTAGVVGPYRVVTRGTAIVVPVPVSNGVLSLASLPANLQTDSDFYVIGASASTFGAVSEGRSVSVRFSTPADRLLALGPVLRTPAMAFTATAAPSSIRLTLPVQAEYAGRADMTVNQFSDGIFISVTMTMTAAYRGSAPEWNFVTPDPAAISERATRLDPAAATSWYAYAASGDFSSLFLGTSQADLTVREAFADGAVGSGATYHSPTTNSTTERSCLLCSRKLPF